MRRKYKLDIKILEGINTISPKSFVSPVKVNEVLRLDLTELGDRLKMLKKSGHVDVITSEFEPQTPKFHLKGDPHRTGATKLEEKAIDDHHIHKVQTINVFFM